MKLVRQKMSEYNPERQHNNYLKSKYGITLAEYDDMLEAQGGCCKICRGSSPGNGKGRFSVDHNHETNEVRALLCNRCNVGLGKFRDSPALLRQAADYLKEHGHYGA